MRTAAGPGICNRIHAKGYTDNVADLMAGKLTRLPGQDPKGLAAACLPWKHRRNPNAFPCFGDPEEEVHADLREAVRQELIQRLRALTGSSTTVCRRPPIR